MRAPNGAKIDLKSALFLRVKIKRIHCKKQGLWGGACILNLDTNQVCFYFVAFCIFDQSLIRHRTQRQSTTTKHRGKMAMT